jgi:type I restriction enzyme S subunit
VNRGERVPLRYLLTEVDERSGADELPLLSVSIHSGVHRRDLVTADEHRADTLDNYKRCRSGDIVLNRMRAFQGAVGVAPIDGLVSPDYAVLRVDRPSDARFLAYALRSHWGVAQMAARLRGIGGSLDWRR